MILYRALQPLLLSAFGALAFVLKRSPGLKEKTKKLWTTWDIRQIGGRPAFMAMDRSTWKNQRPIWIHAASGEFEYAKPVIREIQRSHPQIPIVVTYFSPTYADNVRKFPGVTSSCPLPLDSRDEIEAFLDYVNPAAFLIARTDAWPNTVLATSLRKIPILLFSTTFHEQSRRMNGFGQRLTRATLGRITEIQCVSAEDASVLASIGLTNTSVAGDSRYDQVLARLEGIRPPTVLAMMSALKETIHPRSLIAGSVWSEDLKPVVHASRSTQAETPHTLVLVPHEISEEFLQEIEMVCVNAGFIREKIARVSRLSQGRHPLDVAIVDSVGLLAELYQLGEIAFVGGSFRKTVHSVMEPLAAGCLTIVGPLHTNNREAIEFQSLKHEANGPSFVTAVRDETEFAVTLKKLWGFSKGADFKTWIRREVARRGGATAQVLRWLESQI